MNPVLLSFLLTNDFTTSFTCVSVELLPCSGRKDLENLTQYIVEDLLKILLNDVCDIKVEAVEGIVDYEDITDI